MRSNSLKWKWLGLALLSLFLAVSAHAQLMFDQGAPGTQGPWPVYIQLLPDGGGGNNTVPCPFSVLDGGNTVFNVDCLGVVTPSQGGGSWIEDGGVTYSTDSRVVIGTGTQTSPATTATLEVRSGAANGPLIAAQDNNNRGVVIDQSSLLMRLYATSAASMCIMPDGASNNGVCAGPSDIQFTTDNTVITKYKVKNGGGWLGTTSNHDFYIGAHDEFGAIGMSAAGGITIYDNISFNNHELTSIGNASAGGSAASLNQVQSDLSLVGMTLPGLSPANNLVIGSATGASNITYAFTRYRINLTCLVAGVGAGTTTISLKDATAVSTLVTATESCACTPGAVVSAISTGSSADNDQFNIALSASASTDCATFPLFVANANLTRK